MSRDEIDPGFEAPQRGRRRLRSWLLAGALLATACGQAEEPAAPPPPQVTVVEVRPTKVPDRAEFAGRLQSVNVVDLRARVQGNLLERNFQEGGRVEKDQLLLLIDPAPYKAEVARLEAEIARDRAAYQKALQDRKRTQSLFDENVTSRAQLDQAIAAADAAAAAVRADEAALEKAKLDLEYTRIIAPVSGTIGRIKVDIGNLVGPEAIALLDDMLS